MSDQRMGTCTENLTGGHPAVPRSSYGAAVTWTAGDPGVVELPSGRRVRGRGLRQDLPDPDFGLLLLGRDRPTAWPHRWVAWPDFRLPRGDLRAALDDLLVRPAGRGGDRLRGRRRPHRDGAGLPRRPGRRPRRGRGGWVRARYRRRAVETPAQRRYVRAFGG